MFVFRCLGLYNKSCLKTWLIKHECSCQAFTGVQFEYISKITQIDPRTIQKVSEKAVYFCVHWNQVR